MGPEAFPKNPPFLFSLKKPLSSYLLLGPFSCPVGPKRRLGRGDSQQEALMHLLSALDAKMFPFSGGKFQPLRLRSERGGPISHDSTVQGHGRDTQHATTQHSRRGPPASPWQRGVNSPPGFPVLRRNDYFLVYVWAASCAIIESGF